MSQDQLLITNDGALDVTDSWRARLNAGRVRLFDLPHIPAHADTPASYHEASFVGYAPFAPPAFGVPFLNGGGKAETDSTVLMWNFTAGVGTATIYGWYITDVSGLKVLAACKFLVPVVLTPVSPTLTRIIQITDVSEL
jgi:hypothetical protein